nr:hypothetical protein [Tanacetum cinerariifolium]
IPGLKNLSSLSGENKTSSREKPLELKESYSDRISQERSSESIKSSVSLIFSPSESKESSSKVASDSISKKSPGYTLNLGGN